MDGLHGCVLEVPVLEMELAWWRDQIYYRIIPLVLNSLLQVRWTREPDFHRLTKCGVANHEFAFLQA